jgi:hypothetical protein
VAMKVLSAPFEHKLITSNPEELLARQQQETSQAPMVPIQTPVQLPKDTNFGFQTPTPTSSIGQPITTDSSTNK